MRLLGIGQSLLWQADVIESTTKTKFSSVKICLCRLIISPSSAIHVFNGIPIIKFVLDFCKIMFDQISFSFTVVKVAIHFL